MHPSQGVSSHTGPQASPSYAGWVQVCAVCLLCTVPAAGHNGAVSTAPVLGTVDMVADGFLADWPNDISRQRLSLTEYGTPPTLGDDLQAWFGAAYDSASGALWVVVEVADESIVISDDSRAPWNAGDGCEVYVAAGHERISAPLQYWVRSRERGPPNATPGAWQVGVRCDSLAGRRTYEFRLPLTLAEVPQTIGFDVAVLDRDADGSFSWVSWGRGAGKFATPGNLGDLLLMPPDLTATARHDVVEQARRRNADLVRTTTRAAASRQVLLAGIPLVLAFLHLSLFLYYPRQVKNLHYAAFTATAAVFLFGEFETWHWNWSGVDPQWLEDWTTVRMAAYLASLGFLLSFLYAQFYDRMPRRIWVVAAVIVGSFGLGSAYLADSAIYVFVLTLVICAEGVRVVVLAMWRRREGAWFLGIGFLVFLLPLGGHCATYLAPDLGGPTRDVTYWGFLGVIVSMSAYLARSFAHTSRSLEQQLVEVSDLSNRALAEERERRRLEAENARKTQELEQARQLQLAMLPQVNPQIDGLDVAWHMDTATEVGGDYYDFATSASGDQLTLAVGDATGHGMHAGVVVGVTKGLFQVLGNTPDLAAACGAMSRQLRAMHLGRAGMAMVITRVHAGGLLLSSAGMPPLLVYRAASGEVDEITLPGLPLGLGRDPRYEQRQVTLAPHDLVVLMSDGLPERLDPDGEMFGYERTQAAVRLAAPGHSAAGVCSSLIASGEAWARGRPLADDVTVVALRVVVEEH